MSVEAQFIDALEEDGIDVDSTMRTGPGLSLMYAAEEPRIGTVAVQYAAHRDVAPMLSITWLTGTGEGAKRIGNYMIKREWASLFFREEISGEEYAKKVASTYEEPAHYEGEP